MIIFIFFFSSSPSLPPYRRHLCRRFFLLILLLTLQRVTLVLAFVFHQNACRNFFLVLISSLYCCFTSLSIKNEYHLLDYSFRNNFQFRLKCISYQILSSSPRMALKRINKELLELEKE
jgi:hypothetical protein